LQQVWRGPPRSVQTMPTVSEGSARRRSTPTAAPDRRGPVYPARERAGCAGTRQVCELPQQAGRQGTFAHPREQWRWRSAAPLLGLWRDRPQPSASRPGSVTAARKFRLPARKFVEGRVMKVNNRAKPPSGEWEHAGAYRLEDRDDARVSPALAGVV
jgi:hypothetical protein